MVNLGMIQAHHRQLREAEGLLSQAVQAVVVVDEDDDSATMDEDEGMEGDSSDEELLSGHGDVLTGEVAMIPTSTAQPVFRFRAASNRGSPSRARAPG